MASAYVIAAIAGCFKRESGINPGIWESLTPVPWDAIWSEYGANTGGYGLGQWTNTGGDRQGRLWQLHTFVNASGYSDGDGLGQIAFIIHEDVWYNVSAKRGNYNSLTDYLESDSTNIDDLVWDWLACWEGVPGDAYEERLEAAHQFFDYLLEHQDDSPLDYRWISENRYLSNEETLNNLMCLYFGLNGHGPGPKPKKRKKMPLFMMLRRPIYK